MKSHNYLLEHGTVFTRGCEVMHKDQFVPLTSLKDEIQGDYGIGKNRIHLNIQHHNGISRSLLILLDLIVQYLRLLNFTANLHLIQPLLLYRRAPPLIYSRHKSIDFQYYVLPPSPHPNDRTTYCPPPTVTLTYLLYSHH